MFISVYLEVNAKLQMQAMAMGDIKFLTAGEVDKVVARTGPYGINRAWENWCRARPARPMQPEQAERTVPAPATYFAEGVRARAGADVL